MLIELTQNGIDLTYLGTVNFSKKITQNEKNVKTKICFFLLKNMKFAYTVQQIE